MAILGFKLHLGEIVLPVVLIGALLKMFGGARLNLLGTALAGFSLPFTDAFTRLVTALVPERGPHLTRRLGRRLLSDADAGAAAGTSATHTI